MVVAVRRPAGPPLPPPPPPAALSLPRLSPLLLTFGAFRCSWSAAAWPVAPQSAPLRRRASVQRLQSIPPKSDCFEPSQAHLIEQASPSTQQHYIYFGVPAVSPVPSARHPIPLATIPARVLACTSCLETRDVLMILKGQLSGVPCRQYSHSRWKRHPCAQLGLTAAGPLSTPSAVIWTGT